MYSETYDRAVRRSRWWALVASMLVAGGLGTGAAWGDIQVHVMNCAQGTVKVAAYDSKDSVKITPASSKNFSEGESGSLHCAGEGKGYCQMVFSPTANEDRCYSATHEDTNMHIDSGKWAVVKGFYAATSCHPIVEQVDSPPSTDDCTKLGIENN